MRACRSLRRVSVVRRLIVLLLAGCLPTGGTASAQSGSSAVTRLPEITVYGARTTQTLDDVTASVGIVTDDEIERRALRGFRDSFRLLGNVRDADWTDAGFVLRGISSEGLTPGGTPLASYYVDGIQQTIQGTRRGSRGLWDTEQVEVYRGPQSTLAGRAALAGAIYVKTKDPVFRFEAAARGMGGEDELSTGAGMVNVPLIEEQVALRVAGEYQRSESALDYPTYERFDRFGDFKEDEFLSVRSKLRVQPKALPRTRLLLLYSYAEDAPDVSDIGGPVLGFAFDDDRGDFNTPIFSEVRRTTVHSGGLEVVQELTSGLLLTAQSGFSRSATERPSVNAGTAGETNVLTGGFVQHLFTQEFRLNYFGERTDATVGIYGAWEDEDAGFRRPDFFGFASDVSKTDRDEWNLAGFGEVSYEILPGWKAVLGGRVDHTDRRAPASSRGTAPRAPIFPTPCPTRSFFPRSASARSSGRTTPSGSPSNAASAPAEPGCSVRPGASSISTRNTPGTTNCPTPGVCSTTGSRSRPTSSTSTWKTSRSKPWPTRWTRRRPSPTTPRSRTPWASS